MEGAWHVRRATALLVDLLDAISEAAPDLAQGETLHCSALASGPHFMQSSQRAFFLPNALRLVLVGPLNHLTQAQTGMVIGAV